MEVAMLRVSPPIYINRYIIMTKQKSFRRVGLLLTGCLLAIVVAGCKDKGRIVEPKEGPAHLLIPQQEWNLGTVSLEDGTIQRDVLMINEGSEPLVIDSVEPFCVCIRAEYPERPIRPGHGGRLKVFLNIGAVPSGEFVRSVMVHSNGGSVEVALTGERN